MSTKRFRCGLVVGKFAPLHLGHQLLIDTARSQCEQVVVLSYSLPEFEGYEPQRRRAWLSELFPDVRSHVFDAGGFSVKGAQVKPPANSVAGAAHRNFVTRYCHEVLGVVIDAVFTSEDYGPAFAAALTDANCTRRVDAPAVTHVAVDGARQAVPISASQIRDSLFQQRRWLSPRVYGSLIRRVVVLGAESSGKTTLTEALATAHGTQWVSEYGRELWLERAGALSERDLLDIAREQLRREEAALVDCRDVLFCDTSALTTALYSQVLFGRIAPELEQLAGAKYALTVYCATDFPFVQDGTRGGPEFQAAQDARGRNELARRGTPYLEVRGPLAQRVETVLDALDLRCGR